MQVKLEPLQDWEREKSQREGLEERPSGKAREDEGTLCTS